MVLGLGGFGSDAGSVAAHDPKPPGRPVATHRTVLDRVSEMAVLIPPAQSILAGAQPIP
jgi:hypothetical protein